MSTAEGSKAQPGSSPDRAYLIRCWQEGDVDSPGAASWRFSVEEVLRERNRRGFADLDSLLDYLYGELTGESEKHPQRPDAKE